MKAKDTTITQQQYSQAHVATLAFAMPLGTLLFQLPFGWLSDRTDRRHVLIAAAGIVSLAGVAAAFAAGFPFAALALIYLVWSGAADSLYSVSSAHANDRAGDGDHVTLSASMLYAWSIAGFIATGLGSLATSFYGTEAVIFLAIATSVAFAAFAAWRLTRAPAAAPTAAPPAPITAQSPLPLAQAGGESRPS